MKKILIAAVAIASAFAAQAATFNWGGECLSSSANVDYEDVGGQGHYLASKIRQIKYFFWIREFLFSSSRIK